VSCILQLLQYIKACKIKNSCHDWFIFLSGILKHLCKNQKIFMKIKDKKNDTLSPMDVVADSHIGLIRECNEDSYAYCVSDENQNTLVTVADGIGGHEGGDIASGLCLQTIAIEWRNNKFANIKSSNKIKKFLEKQVIKANKAIYDLNQSFNIQHPMGTTVVAGVFHPGFLTVAHAGDSRCYRMRNGVLSQLTEDHSYVAELVKNNLISLEEARVHPFSHIISRSVGPVLNLDVELNTFERKSGDRYILCTDGLNAHLEDIEIETILYDAENPYEAVRELLYASLRGGGEDNVTVLCVFA
jgi:PPM family protein phosphatase